MKIKAAVVREKSGPFVLEEIELEEPRENEVLVRIVASGLCHTDLVSRDQYLPVPLPVILGHEGAGVVERVGAKVTRVAPGDHVVSSYVNCGVCSSCLSGQPTYCLNFFPLNFFAVRSDGSTTASKDGQRIHAPFWGQSSFATHALMTEKNVVRVDKDLPLEKLAPLGCGVQTGAGGVMNSLKVRPGSSIAIFGAGSVGLSAIMAARVVGATTIIAVDVKPARLEMAKELGATHLVDSSKTNAVEEIIRITGNGALYALECTGIPNLLSDALDSLALTGVCGLISASGGGARVSLECQKILDGRTVRGIVEGDSIPQIFIPQLLELYKQGRFPFDKMLTFYSLEEINKAAEDAESGKVVKVILRP